MEYEKIMIKKTADGNFFKGKYGYYIVSLHKSTSLDTDDRWRTWIKKEKARNGYIVKVLYTKNSIWMQIFSRS